MSTLVVATTDLRRGVKAVKEHVSTDSDQSDYSRYRLIMGPDVTAIIGTDRFTMGMALCSTLEYDGAAGEIVELLAEDVARILSVFTTPGKDASKDGPQYLLRLDVTDTELLVVDASGFDFGGRELRIPRLETAGALDIVPALIEATLGGQAALLDDPVTVSGKFLSRFRQASTVYEEPLTYESRRSTPRGPSIVVFRCGDSFLGALMPVRQVEEDLARAQGWARDWIERLPAIVAAKGAPA